MRKGFVIFIFVLILSGYIAATALSKNTDNEIFYNNFSKKELLSDLSYSEKQIFDNTYKSDTATERLERLELAVFGAIQAGDEEFRIKRVKKSVTNISSGGNGLNNLIRTMNLCGDGWGTSNWAIGNMHNFYPNNYHAGRNTYSHRLPPPKGMYSHRIPPTPKMYGYNPNPITTGDFTRDYTLGTSVKILDD